MSNRAYKVRLCPDKQQAELLTRIFGCCRFVYNQMLAVQKELYVNRHAHLSKYDAFKYMTVQLKPQYPWLREADSTALMNAVFHLDTAYDRFFKKMGRFPKFKSRRSRQSYTSNNVNSNIAVLDNGIKLPKLGVVTAKLTRTIPDNWKLKTATVSMDHDGRYYVSLLYQFETDIQPVTIHPDNVIGLDYKSDGLYVDSNNKRADMPPFYRKKQDKLAKEQRRLSKKIGSKKGERKSSNYKKQQRRVNKIHRHIANQRKDFLHKQSAAIAKQFDAVCVEDLNMQAMSNKGFGNGKATMDNGYGMFLDMLAYKLADRGKKLVKVDKWFPSSQLCSRCGYQNKDVKDLTIRNWTCPECGATHDRDHNAATNVKKEGLRILGI